MAQTYVLPNRKAFADSIVRIFLKYKNKSFDPLDNEDKAEDICKGKTTTRELLEHQKIVRDYLMTETPYRGLLLYHGLGSGKTCSSIAVAESLLSTRKCYVLLPAALRDNYRQEIRKCGDPIYKFEQHWKLKQINNKEDLELGKEMGISEDFLTRNMKFYATDPNKTSNYETLTRDAVKFIDSQIDDVLSQRFKFIAYNGITSTNIDKILPPDQPHMFDDTTIVIDEAHNFISSVVNERELKVRLYDMLYHAKNAKVVLLSGTPTINRPVEISYLMNLIHGPIERIIIPTKQAVSWDEGLMTSFFRKVLDVDTIEYNAVKRLFMLTRNPPYFESVYNEKGERIAVKYNKDFPQEPDMKKWVSTWKSKFETQFGGIELEGEEKMIVEEKECLPTDPIKFAELFLDGMNIKNPLMFQRRIQGLVSYFRTADERLLPSETNPESRIVKVAMSGTQFTEYLKARKIEITQESGKARRKTDLNENLSSYRIHSRLICNYALPDEFMLQIKEAKQEAKSEGSKMDPKLKEKILNQMIQTPKKYLSKEALKIYSPKLLQMLKDVEESVGKDGKFNNIFIYSEFVQLQGLGIFGAILEANGFQEYKIVKEEGTGNWIEDPNLKPNVPAFTFYDGTNEDVREYYRQIFNEEYNISGFPASLKNSIKDKKLCIFMGSKAAAEGITLKNVRQVMITEPHWTPTRVEQAIGRAIRFCSHYTLPKEEQTVRVRIYLTVFTDEQTTTQEGPDITLIRRNDMTIKRYEGDAKEAFLTSDEELWNITYQKNKINKNIAHLLKQAAIDCEIHKNLHKKEDKVIQCLRFDTTVKENDLAYSPNINEDPRDKLYLRNIQRRARKLQVVSIAGIPLLIDPETNEVFDLPVFENSERKTLIQIGKRVSPGEIRWITPITTNVFSVRK